MVLYFLFCLNNSTTILNFLLRCGWYTLFTYSCTGSKQGSSIWNSLHYVVRCLPFPTVSLPNMYCTVEFARETSRKGTKRRTGMSAKKSGLEKARGAGRRAIMAAVLIAAASTRKMMKSISTERVIQL